MLTRKHYEAIAKIIIDEQPTEPMFATKEYWHGRIDSLSYVALKLTNYFESDNPAFDRERFLKACGVQS